MNFAAQVRGGKNTTLVGSEQVYQTLARVFVYEEDSYVLH